MRFFWREQRWRWRSITSVVELTENSSKINFSSRPQVEDATWLLFDHDISGEDMNFARHVHELRFALMKLQKLRSLVSKERIDVNCFSLFWIVKIKRVCFENAKSRGVVLLKSRNKNVRKKIDVYIRYFLICFLAGRRNASSVPKLLIIS